MTADGHVDVPLDDLELALGMLEDPSGMTKEERKAVARLRTTVAERVNELRTGSLVHPQLWPEAV